MDGDRTTMDRDAMTQRIRSRFVPLGPRGLARLVTGILLACLAFPGLSVAIGDSSGGRHGKQGHHGERHPPGSFAARHAQRLGLDDESRQRMGEIVARSGEQDAALRERLHAKRQQLRDLMKASHQPDEQTVMERADEIGRIEVEIHQNRLRAILALREILTPEQRQELMRIREESRERSRSRDGAGHPHHGWRGRGLEACRGDAQKLCGGIEDRRERWACLEAHRSELGSDCRAMLDSWSGPREPERAGSP